MSNAHKHDEERHSQASTHAPASDAHGRNPGPTEGATYHEPPPPAEPDPSAVPPDFKLPKVGSKDYVAGQPVDEAEFAKTQEEAKKRAEEGRAAAEKTKQQGAAAAQQQQQGAAAHGHEKV